MKKILSNILIGILSIIVIILIVFFIQTNIQNKKYPQLGNYTFFQIATGSMAKTINIDDIIIVKLGSEYKTNDIITYEENGNFITHRITEIKDNSIITKGDNNNAEDEPIQKENVIGKVVFTIKNIGVWKKVFSDAKVIISCTLTIILFILLVVYKEKQGKENKND